MIFASTRRTALALAALVYGNAILTYGVLTAPESDRLADAIWKVVVSLPWLLLFTTPLVPILALMGTPVVRHIHAALRPRGAALATAAALVAFLVPAALVSEGALALRDGWDWGRYAVQLGCGAALAAIGAAVLARRSAAP